MTMYYSTSSQLLGFMAYVVIVMLFQDKAGGVTHSHVSSGFLDLPCPPQLELHINPALPAPSIPPLWIPQFPSLTYHHQGPWVLPPRTDNEVLQCVFFHPSFPTCPKLAATKVNPLLKVEF